MERYDTEQQWFIIILQNTYIEQASNFVKKYKSYVFEK